MGDRNSGIGETTDPGSDPGNDAKWDSGGDERQRFFRAPPEDKRITALEAQHPLLLARKANDPRRDVGLAWRRPAAALAGIIERGSRPSEAQNPGVDERVINDDIGLPERVQGQCGQ